MQGRSIDNSDNNNNSNDDENNENEGNNITDNNIKTNVDNQNTEEVIYINYKHIHNHYKGHKQKHKLDISLVCPKSWGSFNLILIGW